MKREDLEAREFGLIIASSNFPFYAAPEADAVMDAMEARIKELESKLYGNNGETTRLLNRINNFFTEDVKAKNIIEECYTCIHQLLSTISKMETTTPKWISAKDRLPEDGACVLCNNGFGVQSIAIYNNNLGFYNYDEDLWVTHWMPLPPSPTTEESSATEKEK